MATGDADAWLDEMGMHRGLYGGAHEPLKADQFNFAAAGLGGPFAALAPMVLQPLLKSLFGQGGVTPFQFAPTQSLYDQLQSRQYWQARQAATTTAAQADRETYVRMLRGLAQIGGTPWGLEQQRSAAVMAGDVAAMAPFLAQMMPETFDEIHGLRGSATVMASFLHRAGRRAIDPVTGQTGLTGDTAGVLAAEMHRRFFGANADLGGWRGLSAGRAGALYDELQTRGLLGLSIGAMTPDEQRRSLVETAAGRQDVLRLVREQDPTRFAAIAGPARGGEADEARLRRLAATPQLATAEVDRIRQGDPTKFDALLRQFDADQVGNRLKNMSGAVAAMREIFGDMGRPNAPMAQLIEGLNALTQGGLATMNPAELERTVRTTQVIARNSGMGMQALQGLTAQAAAQAEQMGLDRRFGVTAAQDAAQFGAAYGQVGRGDVGGFGRGSRDAMTLLDKQLRLQAVASPMSNRLGAAMRLWETLRDAGAPIPEPLAALARAVGHGESTFQPAPGGAPESLNLTDERVLQLMTGETGVSRAVAMSMLRSPAGNQPQVDQYRIANITRPYQRDEIAAVIAQGLREPFVSRLAEAKVAPAEARAIATAASQAQAEALVTMSPAVRTPAAARNRVLMAAARTAVERRFRDQGLTAAEATAKFDQMFPREQLAAMTAAGYGRARERFARDETLGGYGTMERGLDVNLPEVEARRAILSQEDAAEVEMGTALSGLATAGFLVRAAEEVQAPSATLGDAVQKLLGGVDTDLVLERLAEVDPNRITGEGGVGARERLAVMTRAVRAAVDAERTNRAGPGTREQKVLRQRELTAQVAAIRGQAGAAPAAEAIKAALVRANLVPADATPAAVQAMARDVARGKAGDPTLQSIVGGLLATGAFADPEEIYRQQAAALAKAGITDPGDVARAIAGELKDDRFTPALREEILDLGATQAGMDTVADRAGAPIKALVGAKQLAAVSTQQRLLDEALAQELPGEGPERAKALALRKRYARAVLGQGGRTIDLLIGTEAALDALGEGSFDRAAAAQEGLREMGFLAKGVGLTVEDVLTGNLGDKAKLTDAQTAAIKEIRRLNARVGEDRAALIEMAGQPPEKRKPMAPEERERYRKYRDEQLRPDEDLNRRLVKDIADTMGIVGDDEELARAVEKLGKGPESEERRHALTRRFAARKQLNQLTGEGLSLEELKREGTAAEWFEQAGPLGDAGTSAQISAAIDEINDQMTRAAAEAAKRDKELHGTLTMAGRVKVDGEWLDMAGSAGTLGSNPIG